MRVAGLCRPSAVLALALALSVGSSAEILTLDRDSVLTLGIGSLPPIHFPACFDPQISVSSLGEFTIPADLFRGTVVLPTQLFTGVSTVSGLTFVLGGHEAIPLQRGAPGNGHTGNIFRPGGGLGGEGSLIGAVIVNVLFLFDLVAPLTPVGQDGGVGDVDWRVYGTGWTTGPAGVTGITTATPGGHPVNTVTFVGSDNRTPGHQGPLQGGDRRGRRLAQSGEATRRRSSTAQLR
jgi:hypothetical protein